MGAVRILFQGCARRKFVYIHLPKPVKSVYTYFKLLKRFCNED
jgi:hypothetical protein